MSEMRAPLDTCPEALLSPDARALLAEINAAENPPPPSLKIVPDLAFSQNEAAPIDSEDARTDEHIEAFIDLLNQMEDAPRAENEEIADTDIGDDIDDEDDPFFDLEEPPKGWRALWGRFHKAGRGAAGRLVGVKDASAAYHAQSGASSFPFTMLRVIGLVLVAAVPPVINLGVIQPQISDNNRKMTQISSYQASSKKDKKIADSLQKNIGRSQGEAKQLIDGFMSESQFDGLLNNYLLALQKYDVELLSYNIGADKVRKVVVGDRVQEAKLVNLALTGRYDVYTEIRRIFVEQSKNILVVNETMMAIPNSLDLKIDAQFLVPVQRAYDQGLDGVTAKEGGG